jgi:hypothetical protein
LERVNGQGIAALRFAVMSRPSPSERVDREPDDPRAAALWRHEKRIESPDWKSRHLIDV